MQSGIGVARLQSSTETPGVISAQGSLLLTLGAHARSCLVCLSVPDLAVSASVQTSNNDTHESRLGFSWILIRGFPKKPSVQKLWPTCK